jgi:hypothetical protein
MFFDRATGNFFAPGCRNGASTLSVREYTGSLGRNDMDDDLESRGPADRDRINMNEDWEVRYWTGKFGVTREQLADAVRAVGSMSADVERHLQNR